MHLLEVRGTRQRREDGETRAAEIVGFHEAPQPLEVFLHPIRVDDEIPGDTVTQVPGNLHGLDSPVDRRVFHEAAEPFIGRRLQPEEDVEILCDRAPGLEELGMGRDEVRPALDEQPPLADSSTLQRDGELEAAGRVVPEQIVGDEHMWTSALEILADAADRSEAHRALMKRPDRTERAAERASACRLDEPHWSKQQAGVPASPVVDVPPKREGHIIQAEIRVGTRRAERSTRVTDQEARDLACGSPLLERVRKRRHHDLAVSHTNRVYNSIEER